MSRNKRPDLRQSAHRAMETAAPIEQHDRRDRCMALAICGFLLLAVALVFGQSVHFGFVNYDDPAYVYENPTVAKGLTTEGIGWAFTAWHSNNWHPLTWLSHMLDCQLYGLEHPGGHHLTSVLLHAATAILLFLVLWRITGDLWPSALVATVFAIHPLRAESVAWVSERKDVLSGLLFMLTLGAYVAYVRRPFSWVRYLTVVVLFALGLMTKPMLVTLPFVLLLLDYWPLGRWRPAQSGTWRLIVEKIPLLMLTAASCIATPLAQGDAIGDINVFPLLSRIENAVVSYVAYLGQFFYPTQLAVSYPYQRSGLPAWEVAGAFLLLVGVSVAALACWRKLPYVLVGWLWYLGMLVPVIGLVQVGIQAMDDRYTYLPQIGVCIGLAWGIERATRSWPHRRWICGVGSALTIAILMGCAWRQTSYWSDSETLWRHALACNSSNALAHNNLANALVGRGDDAEAIIEYEKAMAADPRFAEPHYNLGNALARAQQLDAAIVQYQKALEINHNLPQARQKLALATAQQQQLLKVLAERRRLIRTHPNALALINDTAWVLATHPNASIRNGAEAIALAQQAVALLGRREPAILDTLAAAYAESGEFAKAIETAGEALDLAVQQNQPALADSIRAEMRLYEAGKPLRETKGPAPLRSTQSR